MADHYSKISQLKFLDFLTLLTKLIHSKLINRSSWLKVMIHDDSIDLQHPNEYLELWIGAIFNYSQHHYQTFIPITIISAVPLANLGDILSSNHGN